MSKVSFARRLLYKFIPHPVNLDLVLVEDEKQYSYTELCPPSKKNFVRRMEHHVRVIGEN